VLATPLQKGGATLLFLFNNKKMLALVLRTAICPKDQSNYASRSLRREDYFIGDILKTDLNVFGFFCLTCKITAPASACMAFGQKDNLFHPIFQCHIKTKAREATNLFFK
jgi:hypothetical protein